MMEEQIIEFLKDLKGAINHDNRERLIFNIENAIQGIHVIQGWERTDRGKFMLGNIELPVNELLIDRNENVDLAVIRIPEELARKVEAEAQKLFFEPNHWPDDNLIEGGLVFVTGYPAILREDIPGETTSYYISILESVQDTTDRRIRVSFTREEWIRQVGEREIEELNVLGGLS